MADRAERPVTGFTTFNQARGSAKPGGIILTATDGDQYYLWVDTTGDLRIVAAASANVNWLTDGVVVGSQS